ncbi:MAG: SBBP repeat-containing protein, partial [Acidobacteriota bacterium]
MQWVRQFGAVEGAVYDVASAAGADGNYYVAGYTRGALPGQTSQGLDDAFVRKYDSSGNIAWTRQFGSTSSDRAQGVAVDSAGNVFVAGAAQGPLPGQVSLGSSDGFVRKYDSNGNELWTRQFGSSTVDDASAVAVDPSGGVTVVGRTYGALPGQVNPGDNDVFVIKFNADGTQFWIRQFGTTNYDEARGVSIDSTGAIIIGGTTRGILPGQPSFGNNDVFVRKYDPVGTEIWTTQFGTGYSDNLLALSADPSGNIYTALDIGGTGELRKLSSSGMPQWASTLPATIYSVSADAAGVAISGYVITALPSQTYAGGGDAFVRRYDTNGTQVWTRQFGTSFFETAYGVASGPSGILVVGMTLGVFPGQSSSGGGDVFLRTYGLTGDEIWTRQFGSLGGGVTYARSVHARGSIYVAGDTNGALSGQSHNASSDVYLARYDTAGSLLWLREFGTVGYDYAYGVTTDGSGNVFVAGATNGTFPGQTRSGAYLNAFVQKYDPLGTELWTRQFGASNDDTIVYAVAADSSGAVYVAGLVRGALPLQTWVGSNDVFLRKYDASGNELWTRQLGMPGIDFASAIAPDPTGGIVVAGVTNGTFPGQSKNGNYDGLVLKFDSAGNLIWTSQFGAPGGDTQTLVRSVAVATDGSVFAGGYTGGSIAGQVWAGSYDAFVRKISPAGVELWTRQFGSNNYEEAWGVGIDPSGNVAVIGHTYGVMPGQASVGGADLFLRRYHS